MTMATPDVPDLDQATAADFAAMFGALADATRVRLLHRVATAPEGRSRVGDLAVALGVSQPTVSHHVRRLADEGFLVVDRVGATSIVSINPACCTGLPHAADVVMGALASVPCCPSDLPADVVTRVMEERDHQCVRDIYLEGIATGDATFETEAPPADDLAERWLPGHRWVAELHDGDSAPRVVGWSAARPVSARTCYVGVAETSVYVAGGARGRGVGKALLHRLATEADNGGLWTLQTSIFPENRASLALHRSAGFRTLGVRSRVAQLDGRWRDTVLMERRRVDD